MPALPGIVSSAEPFAEFGQRLGGDASACPSGTFVRIMVGCSLQARSEPCRMFDPQQGWKERYVVPYMGIQGHWKWQVQACGYKAGDVSKAEQRAAVTSAEAAARYTAPVHRPEAHHGSVAVQAIHWNHWQSIVQQQSQQAAGVCAWRRMHTASLSVVHCTPSCTATQVVTQHWLRCRQHLMIRQHIGSMERLFVHWMQYKHDD